MHTNACCVARLYAHIYHEVKILYVSSVYSNLVSPCPQPEVLLASRANPERDPVGYPISRGWVLTLGCYQDRLPMIESQGLFPKKYHARRFRCCGATFSGRYNSSTYWVGGLSRLTLCKVVSRGRAHGDSAYKLVRASSWKSSHPGKHMGIPS